MLVLLAGGVAMAQEQVGSIEGTVVDKDGAVLPGVTVEAVNAGGISLVAVTDIKGEFRFPRLVPSNYKLTAKLDGFVPSEVPNIDLKLGKALKVSFTLQQGTFQDTITVAADTVAIDVTQSATATSISREQLELLPKGRDFTSVVTQAAGASNEAFLGGISVDGASGSENRYIIDGVNTTSPFQGLQGQNMITDFVEEVQVKSAGYAAEYGGSVGGVINAITKSGGNEFNGYVGAYLTPSNLAGPSRPTGGYESACGTNPDCTITYKKDVTTRWEPGFALGGPILRDKLWFYVGYQPALTTIERTPNGSQVSYKETQKAQYIVGNVKGNLGSSFMYKVAFNDTPSQQTNILPAQDGSTPAGTFLGLGYRYPTKSVSAYVDFIPSSNFLISGRVGDWTTNTVTSGSDWTSSIYFRNGTIPLPTTDPNYRPTGFRSTPITNATPIDKWERKSASADLSWFFNAAGSHQVKFGAQYERVQNDVLSGEAGNLYEVRWGLPDRFGAGVIGTYGSVHVRRFLTQGDVVDNNTGFFLQDSWAITKNFTINYGVRTEQEKLPNYGANAHPELPQYVIQFDYADKMAPRVGFAWDVMSDQKLKVYGSYGNYYDIMNLDMSRGSYGGDHWIAYLYPLNTLDWASLPNGCTISVNDASDNPCPALGTPVTRDLRYPTDPRDGVDPNLKPMEQREWQLGADFQLNPTTVLGARLVAKNLVHAIEDVGFLQCVSATECNEVYITGNPGMGAVVGSGVGDSPVPEVRAKRDYKALELTFNRRFTDNWSLRASYAYSQLKGNYSGLASSDEFGRTDPNVERYFDGLVYGYDQNGGVVDGELNTDRPHTVLLQGIYRFNWGTNVGVNFSFRSGTPRTTIADYNGVDFFPFGRNDLGRTPNLTQTDLYIAHPFKLGGNMGLELSLNVLNLFDQKTVTRYWTYKWRDDICQESLGCDTTNEYYFNHLVPYNADTFMDALPDHGSPDPIFLKPYAWQAARAVRLGLKFTF
jgi:hypothetical protein